LFFFPFFFAKSHQLKHATHPTLVPFEFCGIVH
jgi:hypothetical protein